MARGEHSKARPQGSGLAIGGVFLVSCLAALTLVSSTRGCAGCSGCGPSWVVPPPASFPGAPALGELGWRDAARGRPTWAAPSTPDAAAAERALDAALRARGYVETPRDPAESARSLPFELRSDALDGACGVVVVLGVGTTTITGLDDADQGTVRAPDPSVVSIARCGVGTLRAAGLGTAVVRTWLLPGITPADVARIALPADVVLAHAEAEAILRAHGLEPVDALAREAVPTGTAVVPPARPGASGCATWVGVAEGGGRAETQGPTGFVGRDYALDRAMFGAASCAGPPATETSTSLTDDAGDGVVVVWRPYRSPGGGPTRAPAAGSTVTTVGAAEVVPLADLAAPGAHPAAAPTP